FRSCCAVRRALPSFPTRRSSDLEIRHVTPDFLLRERRRQLEELFEPVLLRDVGKKRLQRLNADGLHHLNLLFRRVRNVIHFEILDRKSTRLNSSHVKISYAVFCL